MSILKVAILGSRGIPARYGGYDTLVEEVSRGLVASGLFQVLVYCRSAYFEKKPSSFCGVQLTYLPVPRLKAAESLLHSFLSSLIVLRKDVDVIFFVDPANAPFVALLRLFGKKVIVHTDGLGWKRRKWGPLARRYYKWVEWICAKVASALVTDNPVMQDYYLKEYGADSFYIAYGSTNRAGIDETILNDLAISPKKYFLVVARLEKENNTDFIVEEFTRSTVNIPLIVVGDAPYNPDYWRQLHKLGDQRVHFLGRVYDQSKLNALYKGAYVYIHGHEVGGTNPSLLRAMDAGTAPLVLNVDFNKITIGDAGFVFEKKGGNLTSIMEHLVAFPAKVREMSTTAQIRAKSHFTWKSVVMEYERLFHQMALK